MMNLKSHDVEDLTIMALDQDARLRKVERHITTSRKRQAKSIPKPLLTGVLFAGISGYLMLLVDANRVELAYALGFSTGASLHLLTRSEEI